MKRIIIFTIYLFLLNTLAFCELILLKDGQLIYGSLIADITNNTDDIMIQTKYGKLQIPRDKVKDTFISESEYQDSLSGKFFWKRHFFDLNVFTGGTVGYNIYGGLLGISIGYQYQFNQYFAFGPGLSGFASLAYQNTPPYFVGLLSLYSGGVVMAQFMIGSIYHKKIAFLLDLGVGWIAAINLGLYIKGFVIKIGYYLSGFGNANNITIGFGYKFNWSKERL